MSKIIGIDFGTTNSLVAVVTGGSPIVVPNKLGGLLTPSTVYIREDETVVVGELARQMQILEPENVITGIKRFIGRRYNEISDIAQNVSYKVEIGKNNLAMIVCRRREYSPQWIVAKILQYLKQSAEDYLGTEITYAVITAPAYFSEIQRQAIKEAGELAGLEVLRIIAEPTAAAVGYGFNRSQNMILAVFDIGGGTFDISLIDSGDGVIQVRSISGDNFLGGDDFDDRLTEWLLIQIKEKLKFDFSNNSAVLQRIRHAATIAKCELSYTQATEIYLPFITMNDDGTVDFQTSLSRKKFEELCQELFEKLERPCEQALIDSGLQGSDISNVLLVGGSTRMPKVSEVVRKVFAQDPIKTVHPEEAVALGAAVQASVLGGETKDILLLDVTPKSLGVEGIYGETIFQIERNTTIPTRRSQIFSLAYDNQTSVEIHIVQGESPLVFNNRSLGRLILENIPPAPKGILQIEVTFDIDANGILKVMAKERASGKSASLTVKPFTGFDS